MATFNANDPTASGMVLTFDDEFNTASISSDSVADGTLWNDHLWYEAPSDGVTVSNGIATIVNTDLSTVNSSGQGFAQTYGYFEADLELPNGIGAWPAFWLMSQAHAQNGANPASEIDIMEGQGVDPNFYFTTLHYDTGTSQDTYNPNPNWTANLGVNLETSFHRYGLLWSPNSNLITFYFDGTPVATATKYSTTDYSPDMVILSTSEGNMIGNNYPNGSSPPLYADYVRVYQFASQDPTAVVAQPVSPPPGDTDTTVLANADGVDPGSAAAPTGSDTTTTGSGTPTPPASDGATPSPDGTIVTGTNGDIISAAGNAFAIDAGGQITENGTVMPATQTVTELAYVNGTVYQEATAQNLWWSYNESTNIWTPTSDPLSTLGTSGSTTASTPSANETVVTAGASGDILSAAGNAFAIDAAGQITENGAVMPATQAVTELAYVNGTVYQEATAQNLWWSFNESTNTWAQTTDPLATTGIQAEPPTLTINPASGGEGSSIPLSMTASQAASDLADGNLTVSIEGPTGTTFSEGTPNADGVYTLEASQLAHLTVTPPSGFTGTLPLIVFATDTEASSGTIASSNPQELDVTVTAPGATSASSGSSTGAANGNTLTLQVAGDMYVTSNDPSGDPQITVSVDGQQVGTYDVTAHHSQGQVQTITLGDVDPTVAHQVQVQFTNDAWDGQVPNTDGHDRNVYVESVALNGQTIAGENFTSNNASMGEGSLDPNAAVMLQNGTVSYTVPAEAANASTAAILQPAMSDGTHSLYLLNAMPQSAEQIAAFNPAEDVLDLAPLLKSIGYTRSNPIADHVVTLTQTSDGSTAVMVDPTGENPSHGTTVVTLDHVLPQNVPAADIWH